MTTQAPMSEDIIAELEAALWDRIKAFVSPHREQLVREEIRKSLSTPAVASDARKAEMVSRVAKIIREQAKCSTDVPMVLNDIQLAGRIIEAVPVASDVRDAALEEAAKVADVSQHGASAAKNIRALIRNDIQSSCGESVHYKGRIQDECAPGDFEQRIKELFALAVLSPTANTIGDLQKFTADIVSLHQNSLLPVAQEWKPIESAPRNGETFLALISGLPYQAMYDEHHRFIWFWHSNRASGASYRVHNIDGKQLLEETKAEEPRDLVPTPLLYVNGFKDEPTHWMPLPPAPTHPKGGR